ncbi:MAG: hypothetical protein SWC96_01795 [Thermodesulfobacteriota bacterium]|nr:hypothetical protein [Thermodesulfobacteriota bacterium]
MSGHSDLDVCFAYGRFTGGNVIKLYKNILVIGDPETGVNRFIARRKLFFGGEFSEAEIGRATFGNGWLKFQYTVADPAARGREVATVVACSVAGGLHELVERTGVDSVRTNITEKNQAFEIHITWTQRKERRPDGPGAMNRGIYPGGQPMSNTVEVKGTIILDLVKQVRVAKDKNWSDYLLPEDMKLIDGEILASQWYPDAFFYRLSHAVFKVIGESKMEACFAFGRLLAHKMAEVYRNIMVPGDPAASIERFLTRRHSFFRGDYADAEKNILEKGENRVMVRFYVDTKIRGREVAPVMMQSILGAAHEIAIMNGAGNVRSKMIDKRDSFDLIVEWD